MKGSLRKSVQIILSLCLTVALLSQVVGCASCPPCIRPVLLIEPDPILVEVETNDEGGLDEAETIQVLDDIDILYGALDRCNIEIKTYNESIKGGK